MRDPDVQMVVLITGLFIIMGIVTAMVVVRQHRETQRWEQFRAEHCRISGSYDREGRRASPRQKEYELKIYHCDDGSVHVR